MTDAGQKATVSSADSCLVSSLWYERQATMAEEGRGTALKEIQLRLGVPQHVLIHLCEKRVINPDFAETSGRGKRREFSERNMFEFAVALALRANDLPVATIAFVVRILRSFATSAARRLPGLDLPKALLEPDAGATLYLDDGRQLSLAIEFSGLTAPLYLRSSLPAKASATSTPRVQKLSAIPADYDTRLEVNLTRIARRILK